MSKNNSVPNQGGLCPLCRWQGGSIELDHKNYTLFRCPKCELVYAWPLDTPDALYENAYADDSGEYHYYLSLASEAKTGNPHVPWPMRRFLKSVKPNGKLLDVGCSTGNFLLVAKRQGWQVSGLEVSKTAATIARDISEAQIWTGGIEDLSTDETFDAITAWEVLEHVPDPVGFLAAAVDSLKAGGVLGLSVPNWDSPWMQCSKEPEHWPPYHLTFWNRETLGRLLNQVGLDHIQIEAKPFAWGEEVGQLKWVYLPVSVIRSIFLNQKGMHLLAIAWKP